MYICLSTCFKQFAAMLHIQNGMVPQPFMQSYGYGGGNVQQVQHAGSVELLEDQMLNLSLNGNGTNGIYAFNKLPPSPFACQLCCQKGHTINECPHVSSTHSNFMKTNKFIVKPCLSQSHVFGNSKQPAFPADIGRTSPASGSQQRLHASESRLRR